MMNNELATSYLETYLNLPTAPLFAILIDGEWGTGKTTFVKTFLKDKASTQKHLYISLYGISSTSEIDAEFYRLLHPALASKSFAIAKRIIGAATKITVNLDLNQDGKSDTSMSVSVPSIDLGKGLDEGENYVLIFDDIERSSIDISVLLGYINYFVEHGEHKVILIANEKELFEKSNKNDSSGSEYLRTKEKLIGKTLKIDPEVNLALESFIKELSTSKVHAEITKLYELIREIYTTSGYKNLRHLRQAVLELHELLMVLPNASLANKDLVDHLAGQFLTILFEVRSGCIQKSDVKKLSQIVGIARYKRPSEQTPVESRLVDLYSRHSILDGSKRLLEDETWGWIFENGVFDRSQIINDIEQSPFFNPVTPPIWRKLWDYQLLTDDVFISTRDDAINNLKKLQITSVGELLHLVSTLLDLHKNSISSTKPVEVISLAEQALKHLCEDKDLIERESLSAWDITTGWGGYGFHGNNDHSFSTFKMKAIKAIQDSKEKSYPEKASKLLELLKTNPFEFSKMLVFIEDQNTYWDIPVLPHINPDDFIKAFLAADPSFSHSVFSSIQGRYRSIPSTVNGLMNELDWLTQVASLAKAQSLNLSGTLKGLRLATLSEYLEQAIDRLNQQGHIADASTSET